MSEIETDFDRPRAKRFIDGFTALYAVFGDDVDFAAEHDVFYVGGDQKSLTKEQRDELNRNGWVWNDQLDSWRFYT